MHHTSPPGEPAGLNGNEKKSGSPKYTRLNEKEDLANLNNRLACYIDRVRNLEYENNRLTVEIKNSQETLRRETSSVKSLYEGELAQTRKCIDKIANEKAKLQIDSQRLFADNLALQSECDARIDECKKLREELSALERRCSELCNACNSLEAEKKRLVEANKDLLKEKASAVSELAQLRDQFEKETLARVDLENALATLKEDYTFNVQLLKQQLQDAKKKIADERTEIDGKLSKEYEERLCHSLQELRDQYELDLEENKEEMRKMYEDKIKCLENQLSRSNNITAMAMEDARSMQSKIDKLNQTVKDLEKERNLAVSDARELEKRLDQMKSEYIKEYAYHEDEMKKLREEMANQAKEYEELMDVKVALDMEISAFRKLLESEEERLNITPVHSSSLNSSSRRILKGKRRHEESFEAESNVTLNCTNSSALALSEVSPEGKFIKIINNSPEDIAIGGWELVQVANGTRVSHLFKSKAKVKGGKTLIVWSGEEKTAAQRGGGEEQVIANVTFQPADQMTITLLDSSGQEVATAVLNKVTSTSSRPLSAAKRHVGHSFSQDQLQYSDEKCSLM